MRQLLIVVLAACSAAASADRATDPMAGHEWRHRVLLVYASDEDSDALARFRERVRARQCGIEDRDLVIGEVVGTAGGRLGTRELTAADNRALRRRHEPGRGDVTTVLVGKDGGVKMRVSGVAELDAVFRRIDGMPMRRSEMKRRGRPDCAPGRPDPR